MSDGMTYEDHIRKLAESQRAHQLARAALADAETVKQNAYHDVCDADDAFAALRPRASRRRSPVCLSCDVPSVALTICPNLLHEQMENNGLRAIGEILVADALRAAGLLDAARDKWPDGGYAVSPLPHQ